MPRRPDQPEKPPSLAGLSRLLFIERDRSLDSWGFTAHHLKNENSQTHERRTPKEEMRRSKPVSSKTCKGSSEGASQHSSSSDQREKSLRLAGIKYVVG